MKKTEFLFFAAFLVLLAVFTGPQEIPFSVQVYGSMVFIALVGIPHGAIDHIIFMENNRVGPVMFYGFYVGAMGLFVVTWLLFPCVSLVLFILLSAYHFGQSRFSDLERLSHTVNGLLSWSWGCSILFGLFYYKNVELAGLLQSAPDIAQLQDAFDIRVYAWLLPFSTLLTFILLVWALHRQYVKTERFFSEIYFLLLIHLCFYALPLLVGFTLYFITLHAASVLSEEFHFLRIRRPGLSVWQFIVLLMPYTLLSVLGGGILFFLVHHGWVDTSNLLLAFIIVSALTLPHSIVMHGFYRKTDPSL